MDLNKFQGVLPAFYACYDHAGEVSPHATAVFAQYLMEKGVHGLYVGGSSGESDLADFREVHCRGVKVCGKTNGPDSP